MQPAQRIRQKLAAGDLVTGILATNHAWPELVELCLAADVDYLIVDQEHGPHTDAVAAEICRLGRVANFAVFVRTISTKYDVVRRAIDMGPAGLMFPCVEDISSLDEARDAIWLPPRGRRRPGGPGNSWVSNYKLDAWLELEESLVVLPQVESRQGLANATAIAQHEIVTALAVGPYDLSGDLGCLGDVDHPDMVTALTTLRSAAAAAGKAMWMIGDGVRWVRAGYRFVCFGEPSMILREEMASRVRLMKENRPD